MTFLLWAHLIMALVYREHHTGREVQHTYTYTHTTPTPHHTTHTDALRLSPERKRRLVIEGGVYKCWQTPRFPPALLSIPELGLFELPKEGNKF